MHFTKEEDLNTNCSERIISVRIKSQGGYHLNQVEQKVKEIFLLDQNKWELNEPSRLFPHTSRQEIK